ncbi:MAG: hypothetical protein ABW174_06225 [Flavitalea sp.]
MLSATIKSPVFIDMLSFTMVAAMAGNVCAVLRDDYGYECSRFETEITEENQVVTWKGLNDLPYGVYTLELSKGKEEMKLRLVKRV